MDELNRVRWDAVIVDEVHRLKEAKAKVTQALKRLKCRRRIGLTGTLLQNKYEELWCVLDWANPGCLGSQQVKHAARISEIRTTTTLLTGLDNVKRT